MVFLISAEQRDITDPVNCIQAAQNVITGMHQRLNSSAANNVNLVCMSCLCLLMCGQIMGRVQHVDFACVV